MSVLVTGVNGLTGLHTARTLLEGGFKVVGHDRNSAGELNYYPEVAEKIHFVWGDMTNMAHLLETAEKFEVEHIIHLAAVRNEVLHKTLPGELFRANILGTQNILELGRLGKVKRVIYASTAAVYGKMDDPDRAIAEDTPQNPHGIYANCKAMCENLCRAYRNVYEVDVLILRPSRVYGRMANLDTLEFGNPLSSFVYKVTRGEPIREESGADFGGDFTYAPDLAYGFYRALVTPKPRNWIFNVSSGRFYRLSEVAQILKDLYPESKISVGPGMLPYITQSPIRGPLDISRAEKELAFRVRYDLRGSLEDFVETIRQRGDYHPKH